MAVTKAVSGTDELFVLLALREEGTLGRYRLARMLGVSEGIVRGLLNRMVRSKLIRALSGRGASLTRKGESKLQLLLERMRTHAVRRIEGQLLNVGPRNVVFHIENAAHMVKMGLEQRDAAVRAGASGATTLIFDGRRLRFPGVHEELERYDPQANRSLLDSFKPKRNDVLLICFAQTWWDALKGAIAATRTLVGE